MGGGAKRPIRIANCSGAIGDGFDQIYELAKAGGIDAITGDYLAEFNLAWRAIDQKTDPDAGFETSFLEQLAWHNGDGVRFLAEKKIKVVHDGGALNPRGLAVAVDKYVKSLGVTGLKIAWVTGDDLTPRVRQGQLDDELKHLDYDGVRLTDAEIQDMLSANAYTGLAGIQKALEHGADMVICGRCCDASPAMGLAAWWHGWGPEDYDALAGAMVAGHLTECGPSVTGGNFCGVREIECMFELGYPIVEIEADGSFVITKNEGTSGALTLDTVKAQATYEIQGPLYFTPDVTTHMDTIHLSQEAPDRVRVYGVKGSPPPPTTKLAVCLLGGWQAELFVFCAGLDTEAKFAQMKEGVLRRVNLDDFSTFSVERYGSSPPDPKSQAACTVAIRLFAQSPRKEALAQLRNAIFFNGLGGFCGMHTSMDWRTLEPRAYVRYFPVLVSQSLVPLQVHFLGEDGREDASKTLDVPARPASLCRDSVPPQPDYDPTEVLPADLKTVRRPLGDLVFARSGDKGANSNIGFWVRDPAAYPWFRSFMTRDRVRELLGDDWSDSYRVERCEFPHILGVHVVVRGLLQDGVSSSSLVDGFGKSVGEFLRARHVDLPVDLVAAEDARRAAALAKAGRTYKHL